MLAGITCETRAPTSDAGRSPTRERDGDAPIDVTECPVCDQGRNRQHPDGNHAGAGCLAGGEAEHHHEQRHEKEAPTIGEQAGQEADRERRRKDEAAAITAQLAPRSVTLGIGHQHAHADHEQHHARQDQQLRAADRARHQRADDRAGHPAENRQLGDAQIKVARPHVPASAGDRGGEHGRQR